MSVIKEVNKYYKGSYETSPKQKSIKILTIYQLFVNTVIIFSVINFSL